MKIDYGTLLCGLPIELTIGASIVQPHLYEIAKIGFETFYHYEALISLTPKEYYTTIMGENGKQIWDKLDNDSRDNLQIYDVVEKEEWLQQSYTLVFNFFFDTPVKYYVIDNDGYFMFVKDTNIDVDQLDIDKDVYGAISRGSFSSVLGLIRQVCCMEDEYDDEEPKFKNEKAKQIYYELKKAKDGMKKAKKSDPNLSLPNIISAVSNTHPTINPLNVWNLTVFQLLDSFTRLQSNKIYDINATSVSVWGDEKKQFDFSLWYKKNDNN